MFTGLVQTLAEVVEAKSEPPGLRLRVRAPEIAETVALGASIAVNGCCLTVVEIDSATGDLAFEAGDETLRRTTLGELAAGDRVNLERSLRFGDELSGHLVAGHVDAVGTLDVRTDDGAWSTCWFRVPAELTGQMAVKGSIAIDGVSLTLVAVERERFSVMLIPHTLSVTTLGSLRPGSRVNLETDLLAKYVQRQLDVRLGAPDLK